MLLTLDIGNTEITAGLFEGDELQAHWRLTTNPDRTPDEWGSAFGAFLIQAGHSPNEVRAVCLASVAPSVTQSVVEGVARSTGCTGVAVDARAPLPVRLDVDEPLSVGADRIVNVLAAVELFHRDIDRGGLRHRDHLRLRDRRWSVSRRGDHAGTSHRRRSAHPAYRQAAGHRAARAAPRDRPAHRGVYSVRRALSAPPTRWTASSAGSAAEWPRTAPRRVSWLPAGSPRSSRRSPRPSSRPIRELTLRGLRIAAGHLGLRW